MEVFIADRQPDHAAALIAGLGELGVQGRDAAYLASVLPPTEGGTPEMARYIQEFEFMVGPAARASAARLIGFHCPLG